MAEIRDLGEEKRQNIDRKKKKKPQGKNIMACLLHREAIMKTASPEHSQHT